MPYRSAALPRVADRRRPRPAYRALLERVRYDGAYPTAERAEEAVRLVLAGLGRQLTGQERAELAARLPAEAARLVTEQVPAPRPLTGREFVEDLAARSGGTPATLRWDAGTVFAAVSRLAGRDLVARVIRALPPGYALLFGCAELTRAA